MTRVPPPAERLSFYEIAAETGIKYATVRDAANRGRLLTIAPGRPGHKSYCTRAEVQAWLARRANPTRKPQGPRSPRPTPTSLSIEEVARLTGATPKTVRRAIVGGRLIAVRTTTTTTFVERDAATRWNEVRDRHTPGNTRAKVAKAAPRRRSQSDERAAAANMIKTERGLSSTSMIPRRSKRETAAESKPRHPALLRLDEIRARGRGRAT